MHDQNDDFRGTGGLRDGAGYSLEQEIDRGSPRFSGETAGEGAESDLSADTFAAEGQGDQTTGSYAEQGAQQEGSAQAASDGAGYPYFEDVHRALINAEATAVQSGRQVLANAYEDLRIKAVANLDLMQAHAQLALAGLKWSSEDHASVATYLGQAQRCLNEAVSAFQARMQLDEIDMRAQEARNADHASQR